MSNFSQFFTPDSSGESHPVAKVIAENTVDLLSSHIRARNRQSPSHPIKSLAIDGIPGIPFEMGIPDPDLFYQGEDIIYDLFLVYDGTPVKLDNYDIKIAIKSSSRATNILFEAYIDNGLYNDPSKEGYYELWIPNSVSAELLAGTYFITVQISDKLGEGLGRHDRKHILLQHSFNLEYSNYSPSPENAKPTATILKRYNLEPTWPNKPNTIGQTPPPPDTLYAS
jgi:hypothetical protein